MILALLLLSLFLAVAHGASAFVVLALAGSEKRLLGLAPRWRAKLYRGALLAPFTIASMVLVTVLAPSFLELAGMAGHCDVVRGHHAHLCFLHFSMRAGLPVVLFAGILPFAAMARGLRSFRSWSWERRAVLSLVRTGHPRTGVSGAIEFDSDVPVCVTLGLWTTRIFLSTAAIRTLGPADLEAALEHERAHALRGDDLALFLGRFAALLHLPFFGLRLLSRWQQESEIVCDAIAAHQTGAPADLAGAIVRFHRALMDLRRPVPLAGACLCQTSAAILERRVCALLEGPPAAEHAPDDWTFVIGTAVALLATLLLQATSLHHATEAALGLLGVVHS